MRWFVVVSLFLLLGADTAWAQSFSPKDYPDCLMLYAKKATSRDAAMLMRMACKCRFQNPSDPDCAKYSQTALDCLLTNLLPVEQDSQAWGVERACRTKNPVGK